MASKFMSIKKIVIPFLTMVILTTQITGCVALSQNELAESLPKESEIVLEYAEQKSVRNEYRTLDGNVYNLQFSNQRQDTNPMSTQEKEEYNKYKSTSPALKRVFTTIYKDYGDNDQGAIDALETFATLNSVEGINIGEEYLAWKNAYKKFEEALETKEHEAQLAADPFENTNSTLIVVDDSDVRNGYTEEAESIGQLNLGDRVSIIGIGVNNATGWYKIDFHGTNGYIKNDVLSDTPLVDCNIGVYIIDEAPIRSGWSSNNEVVKTGHRGEYVTAIAYGVAEADGWIKVESNGTYGYVYQTHLSYDKPVEQSSNNGGGSSNNNEGSGESSGYDSGSSGYADGSSGYDSGSYVGLCKLRYRRNRR